jgi:hypothetical protein
MENFVPFLTGELGLDIEETVHYSWLDEETYPDSTCPEGSGGCQIEEHAYARKPALLHELIHAVTYVNGMNQLSFFTEGLAVAYDPFYGAAPGPRYRFYPAEGEETRDPRDFMTGELDDQGYNIAGSFVTFLLMRHGPEKFVSLTRRLDFESSLQEVGARFLEVYGVNMDDEVEMYRMNGPCEEAAFEVRPYDCAMPLVPWGESAWSWSASMVCDDDSVAGGVDPDRDHNGLRSVALVVPRAGRYVVKLEADGDAHVTLGRCFGCPWAPADSVLQTSEALEVELSTGSHFVRVTALSDEEPAVRVTLVPAE